MTTQTDTKPTSAKAQLRRNLILDAAIRLVKKGGVDSITIRNVATEAKVPLGSLTYYFESREELITLALRHYMKSIEDRAEKMVHPRLAHFEEGELTLDTILDLLVETDILPDMCVVEYEMILYAARKEELMLEVRTYRLNFEAQLASALEQAGISKPVLGARTLLNIVDGFDIERLIKSNNTTTDLKQRLQLATQSW